MSLSRGLLVQPRAAPRFVLAVVPPRAWLVPAAVAAAAASRRRRDRLAGGVAASGSGVVGTAPLRTRLSDLTRAPGCGLFELRPAALAGAARGLSGQGLGPERRSRALEEKRPDLVVVDGRSRAAPPRRRRRGRSERGTTTWPSRTRATMAAPRGRPRSPNLGPDGGRVLVQGHLHEPGVAALELQQPDEHADRDRLLDEAGEQLRGRDGHVDAPRLVEQPVVLRVVDPGDAPGARRTPAWRAGR